MSNEELKDIISSIIDEKMDELINKFQELLEKNVKEILKNNDIQDNKIPVQSIGKKKIRKTNWKDNLSSTALDDYKALPSFRNPFFMFRQHNSDDIKDQKEDGERHAATAGRLWRDMEDDDKQEYEDMSKESEREFSEALISWVEQYTEYEQYLPAAKKKLIKKYKN